MPHVRRRSIVSAIAPFVVAVVLVVSGACGGSDPSPPAGADPAGAKVTVAGDSVALGAGIAMRDVVDGGELDGEIVVKAIGEDGTGLARPDNFDWPARLAELARDFPPEVLVFSVGSNDAQDLADPQGDTVATMADGEAWDLEYSARLGEVFDEFADTGTTVVWLGHIRPTDERVADANRRIHALATEVASTRGWVQVEDLAELTGSGAAGTSECLSSDGLHLSDTCYDRAASALLERIDLG